MCGVISTQCESCLPESSKRTEGYGIVIDHTITVIIEMTKSIETIRRVIDFGISRVKMDATP